MTRADRRWLLLLAATWLLFAAPVTGLLYWPVSASITGEVVTVDRRFPGDLIGLPRPVIAYREAVHPLTPDHNGGHFCQAPPVQPTRYVSRQPVGRWAIPWARPCLSDPAGFVWDVEWRAFVGMIPLGPVRLSLTVERTTP